VHHLHDLLP
jgi:hypothetical protein